MTARHFGLSNARGRTIPGGTGNRPSAYSAKQYYRADLPNSPSSFLRAAPVDDPVRERAAKIFCTVVISCAFAIPLMLAGIMLCFR